MTHLPDDVKDAVRRFANGATVGMVKTALKEKGLGPGPSTEVLEIARRIINRRARIKHGLIGALGLFILVWAGYWSYHCLINQNPQIRISVVVMGVGLLLSIYGIYNLTQDEIPSDGSHSRFR